MHLKDGAVEWAVKQYGYKRVEHVLANTVQELSYDDRFHPDNKEWANRHFVPEDGEHNACFVVRSHPADLVDYDFGEADDDTEYETEENESGAPSDSADD